MGEHGGARREPQSPQSEGIRAPAAIDDNADGHALLGHLASTEGITPETVAALLLRCNSERLRHAILAELSSKWGNAAVQRTLAAAERQQRARQGDSTPSPKHGDSSAPAAS